MTGYGIFKSSGGKTCIKCGTIISKGLPHLSPVKGKDVIKEMSGKAMCHACLRDILNSMDSFLKECDDKIIDRYEKKRFVNKL
jgi:hypothetical protein